MLFTCLATCPKGLEYLLVDELESFACEIVGQNISGVIFRSELDKIYHSCLWSRLANRILLELSSFAVDDLESLYDKLRCMKWTDHINVEKTFSVDFSGKLPGVRNSHFAALKVKDAIVDSCRETSGSRPNVDPKTAQQAIVVRIIKRKAYVYFDMSGGSLHKRGYRIETGPAPLKENLAAAIVMRSGWPRICAERDVAFIDPMCGSATILIEAALIAANIAPGLYRRQFGLQHWQHHRDDLWQECWQRAQAARREAANKPFPEVRGYDKSLGAILAAEKNILKAGLEGKVRVVKKDVTEVSQPSHMHISTGVIVSNPPYGERLGDVETLKPLYAQLGVCMYEEFPGWNAAILTGSDELGRATGLRSHKQYKLHNGPIESKLLLFTLKDQHLKRLDTAAKLEQPQSSSATNGLAPMIEAVVHEPGSGAQMFANRLRKNQKALNKWISRESIDCYRIYDSDMPEYSVAIDRYADWLHIAEYKAPDTVEAGAAQQRLQDILSVIPQALNQDPSKIVLKQRSRKKGSEQYERFEKSGQELQVLEGAAKFYVNLKDYLDTGLFLDHRLLRLRFYQVCNNKTFLNLFCYTASASVHAALGGASTTSVDMSATYIHWAKRNFELNKLNTEEHQFVQADCLEWLKKSRSEYDVIFLDPPTFSTSKRMQQSFDVQRDHVELIRCALTRLKASGRLYFSTNKRRFKLAEELSETLDIENITSQTIDKDFARNNRIHQCWCIKIK